ncbi:MAG: hypothetical protein F6K41_10125 [Symploca sp. SIO3E6]|nr:hypothetical protein [Caldora sp. SIO3E6]
MKGFLPIVIITLLVSGFGLVGCRNDQPTGVTPSPTTSPAEEEPIPMVLPTLADVELTEGGSKSGRVTAITNKELTIEASGETDSIAIKEIKRVKFSQKAPLPRGSAPQLRGEVEIWRVTPLTALQIKDSSQGLAEVPLSAVKKKESPPDPLGEPSSYEVKEMWFDANSPGTMRLKVEGID